MSRKGSEINLKSAETITFHGFVFLTKSRELRTVEGKAVDLRSQSAEVLLALAARPGEIVSKGELMQAVWPDTFVTEDSLTQCVADIRRALGGDGHLIVETFPKRGYRLNAEPVDTADANAVTAPEQVKTRFSQRGSILGAIVLAAIVLLIVGPTAIQWRGKTPATGVPYVAVLPFAAIPADPPSERLARGLTEDIITDLAHFPEFKVIARHSIVEFVASDPVAAAEKLAVSFVVTGSIQVMEGRARIAAQLIDGTSGRSLWSERWDRPSGDIFAIQTEISEQIANRLGGGDGLVQETGRIAAHRKPPASLSAYELYLLGTEKLEQMNQEDVKEAIRLLKRAVELDPGLARAWVELSHSYRVMADLGGDPAENFRLSGEAAMKAVELDPGDPEAHIVEGKRLVDANNMVQAEFRFNRALQMAPNQWEIMVFYLVWASRTGKEERGAALVDEAIRLNPHYPIWAARLFAYAYFMAGRNDEALTMLERLDEENLGPFFWQLKAGALAATGRREEAKQAVERALKAFPNMTVEGTANDPSVSEGERQRLVEPMRLAGFPLCATPEALAAIANPISLPECR